MESKVKEEQDEKDENLIYKNQFFFGTSWFLAILSNSASNYSKSYWAIRVILKILCSVEFSHLSVTERANLSA